MNELQTILTDGKTVVYKDGNYYYKWTEGKAVFHSGGISRESFVHWSLIPEDELLEIKKQIWKFFDLRRTPDLKWMEVVEFSLENNEKLGLKIGDSISDYVLKLLKERVL